MKSTRLSPLTAEDGGSSDPAPELETPWAALKLRGGTWEPVGGSFNSVQWIDLPGVHALDLELLEPHYFAWVPRLSAGFVRPRAMGQSLRLAAEPFGFPTVIGLDPFQTTETTLTRPILGGFLAHPGGHIAFERHAYPEGLRLVVAVRGLKPRLPRWLYVRFQAQLHERSTFGFLRQVAIATKAPIARDG